MIDGIGSGILHLGMAPPNSTGHRMVGLYSKNRYEWVIAEQACHAYSLVDVPIYDTLGPEAMDFVLAQTQMATVFCDRAGVEKLVEAKKRTGAGAAAFAFIVCMDAFTDKERDLCAAAGLKLSAFDALRDTGSFHKAAHIPPAPTDVAFICYTSGTTGPPKGAMIAHKNLVADSSSAHTAELGLTASDVHLSYLPLAHIFERLVQAAWWMCGGSIGFYQGDTLKLTDDLKALRPTVFPSVPRLYNKIYDKITGDVKKIGGTKEKIFNHAYASKKYWLNAQGSVTHSIWDKVVFKNVAAKVGLDRVRVLLTGSAPIAPHVIEFLRIVFSGSLCEGYGQTECSAAATLTSIHDQTSLGHVGGPLACNEVKLVSIPEMGYLVTDTAHGTEKDDKGVVTKQGVPCDGRGEVCYRGHNVFSGYYKDPAKTAEALDADGWLHSGDVGVWTKQGTLQIIDRKKNIFKLSQGEYVAAEKIELVYVKATIAAQVFVYGDSLHSMLLGVVIPEAEAAKMWASKNGVDANKPLAEIIDLPAFKEAAIAELKAQSDAAGLQSFERVKGWHFDSAPWTPDDLLTPSFKLKRLDAKKK
jgi:long-chain acyl-CoA synthetase